MALELWDAIIAGVIGIVGGVFGGYLSYRFNKKIEARKISLNTKSMLIKKVIEAYEKTYELKKYISDRKQNPFAIVNSKERIMTIKKKNVEDFIEKTNSLLSSKHAIYLPQDFRKEFYNFRNLLFEILEHTSFGNQQVFPIEKEDIRISIDEYINNLNKLIRNFNPDSISDIKKIVDFINKE